jgi:hypothetical protein
MSCEISTGYTKPLCANRGGISSLVVVNIQNVELTVVDDVVTAIASQTRPAYELKLDINSGFANQTLTGSRENNTMINVQAVMAMLKDDELTTEQLAQVLSEGYFLTIVRYRNGKNKVFGLTNGLFNTTVEGVSGQAGGDMNGYTVNLAGEEVDIAPHISNTLVGNLLSYSS